MAKHKVISVIAGNIFDERKLEDLLNEGYSICSAVPANITATDGMKAVAPIIYVLKIN